MVEQIGLEVALIGVGRLIADSKRVTASYEAIRQSIITTSKARVGVGPAGLAAFATAGQASAKVADKVQKSATAAAVATTGVGVAAAGADKKIIPFNVRLAKSAYLLGRLQFVAISTVAALATLGAPVIFAAQLEKSLSLIVGLTETPKAAIAGLKKEILALSKETAISPADLGAGAYFILSSGIKDTAKAMEVLRLSAKASVAGLGETKTVASSVTSVMNAYNLSIGDAAGVVDDLITIIKLGKGEPTELAQSLGFIIPIASQMGIEFEQVGAVLATLTNQGLNAAESVTALRGILAQILSPSVQARKLFEQLGIPVEQLRREVDENFIGAMTRLFATFEGNEAVVAALFPDIRGLIGVLAAFGNQAGQTQANLQGLQNNTGSLDIAVEAATDTIAHKFNVVLNNARISLTELGDTIIKVTGGFDLILKPLGLLFSNLDLLIVAATTFGAAVLAGIVIPALAGATIGIIGYSAAVITMAQAEGIATAATLALGTAVKMAFPFFAAIVAVIALVIFRMRQGGKETREFSEDLEHMISQIKPITFDIRLTGVDKATAEVASFALAYQSATDHLEATKLEVQKLAPEFSKLTLAEQEAALGSSIQAAQLGVLNELYGESSGVTRRAIGEYILYTKEQKTALQGVKEFSEGQDELTLASNLSEINIGGLKISVKTLGEIFPVPTQKAAEMGQSLSELSADVDAAAQPAETLAEAYDNLADAMSGVRSEISALLGVETKEETVLRARISSLELSIAQRRAEGLAAGMTREQVDDLTAVQEAQIDTLEAQLDVYGAQKQALEDAAVVANNQYNPAMQSLLDIAAKASGQILTQGQYSQFAADRAKIWQKALDDLRAQGMGPVADFAEKVLLPTMGVINSTVIKLSVDDSEVIAAGSTIERLWKAVARVFPTVRIRMEVEEARLAQVAAQARGRELLAQADRDLMRAGAIDLFKQTSEDVAGAIAGGEIENPFEEFVKAEQIQEIIREAAQTGRIAWSDVAQLWELGAHEAAEDFARFLRGEVNVIGEEIGKSFRAIATKWMDDVEVGILEGTVNVLDALDFLEKGMIDAARSIVEGLSAEAESMAEAWRILLQLLETGLTDIRDVQRLFEIGQPEAALEFLRFITGKPGVLMEIVPKFQREKWKGIFMQEGGIIPPGQVVPATLHGPEAVIPLRSDNIMFQRLLSGLKGIGAGSGGEFRNYGNVSVFASSDADRTVVRSMRRALGT